MKTTIFLQLLFCCLDLFAQNAGPAMDPNLYSTVKKDLESRSYLDARAKIRRQANVTVTASEWKTIRSLLHQYPQIGLDVSKFWESKVPDPANTEDLALTKADALMLDNKFDPALKVYTELVNRIRRQPALLQKANRKLYFTLLHSQARALFSLKQYDQALQSYQKIPQTYEGFRQVQFEKMWTAYQAKKWSLAIGAVASQAGGFFAPYFEPESYLIQYYIFKRMCREKELAEIIKRAKVLNNSLQAKSLPISKWLKKDVETLIYAQAYTGKGNLDEKRKLEKYLVARYRADLLRLSEQMDSVNSYFDLLKDSADAFVPIANIVEPTSIFDPKFEKWNVTDKEEWSDEVGGHVFLGQSSCKKM